MLNPYNSIYEFYVEAFEVNSACVGHNGYERDWASNRVGQEFPKGISGKFSDTFGMIYKLNK